MSTEPLASSPDDPAKPARHTPSRTVALGDFRILRKLGVGSMGTVYLAQQRSRGRQVALKVLGPRLARRADLLARFYREAGLLCRLDHAGIVHCFGIGEEAGFHYFALEYIDGPNLGVLRRQLGGRLPAGDALHVALRCAEALDYAHGQGVIHCDVKPSNLLISRAGEVKLTDLGLARPLDECGPADGEPVGRGTPAYVAPEQARDATRADHRSDIYSLGGVLYECLTGRAPFQADGVVALLRAKERGEVPPPSGLCPELPARCDVVLARMLARDPEARYASCAELIGDLHALGLAHDRLTVPLSADESGAAASKARPVLEVLLICDNPDYVPLAEMALRQADLPGRLRVAEDGQQALALLREAGRLPACPVPCLILAGLDHPTRASLEALDAARTSPALCDVPLRLFSTSPQTADLLAHHGPAPGLWVTGFDDLGPLAQAVRDAYARRTAGESE
jgi:serine/threonine protein kinase